MRRLFVTFLLCFAVNAVFAELGMDYKNICDRVRLNGEPGFAWLDNMRAFGRMGDPPVSSIDGLSCVACSAGSSVTCVEMYDRTRSVVGFRTSL